MLLQLDQNENFSKLTRKEALAENERVQFENDSIVLDLFLLRVQQLMI